MAVPNSFTVDVRCDACKDKYELEVKRGDDLGKILRESECESCGAVGHLRRVARTVTIDYEDEK